MSAAKSTVQTKIATFDYLRKSTKGEELDAHGNKKQRQEKSIEQQRGELDRIRFPQELESAGFTGYEHAGAFADEGVSGWKLGSKRPGFYAMIQAIKEHPAACKVI